MLADKTNLMAFLVDLEPDEWIKDSGCSKHMTGNRKLFSSYKAYNRGNIIFGSNLRGNIIGQICDNKCIVTFSEHDSEITKDGKVTSRGIRKKGLYVIKLRDKPKDKICLATIDENSTLWHRRLGHANMRLIQSLASKELVRNLPKLKFDQHFCDACKNGKQAHTSHKAKNIVSTTRCLELLHMDLFGPSAVWSYGGNRYTLVIVDNYSSKFFILNTKYYLTKFDPKSYKGVFLGYSQNSKAYIILNKHTRKIEESLNVTFDETPPPTKTSPLADDDLDEEETIKVAEKKILENDIEDETLEIDEIVNIKESRNHPLENVIGNLNQRTLRSQAQNQSNFFCFISTIEPKNVNEALTDESWIIAMQEELNQFNANNVWELVPQPQNMTIIGTKWVFINKLDENGIVSQNKARLVDQGYNQQEGINYDETYAPVARHESIRILLAYACALDFKLFQMDVKSAFLNGFINEENSNSYLRDILGDILGKDIDDEESNHEDALDTSNALKQQQQVIPQTTAISNIKLPILKKEEYDIWAMEMEHYLEYIDNEDGIVRILSPVTAAEIQVVEKERKAKNILLMAIPKEHMRRFYGMYDAKETWEAIRTRFGGNANSKKMQKAVFKQQFEAFKISSSEGLEKGYDRFQQLLSQLEAHGAEVSTEDANHKFLRSLPAAWSNLAMTMRTKPEIDTLSIDDLYNNLRVFEQEIQGASKTSSSAQNVAFVSQSKSSTNKVKSGFTGAYSTCTPSTSSTNIPEKEVLAGFADEKLECFNCHNTGHFAREYTAKGTHDGKKKRDSFYQYQEVGKQEKNQMGLLTMDDGIVNWGEHTSIEEINHALMAISSNNEVTLYSKTCIDSYNTLKLLCDEQMNQLGDKEAQILAYSQAVKKLEAQLVTFQKQQLSLNEKLTFQANEIYEKDEKLKRYRRIGMKAVKEKEQLQKTLDTWKDSSKNL
ncbi:retrovirus-related pol polyprotein from transposon TNT 1-94 [Tanacetum coccineum]|uniref:Retrovirus-related pol polyprotein from transposon TNT 1-94 n=1 Tax=Tanacetum coccineum TaxID=301880 RepID=A0ABQ5JD99_9ASTR